MTMGVFLPLLTALGALFVVPMFALRLQRLPAKTDPGYIEVISGIQARGSKTIIAAELAIPVPLYIALNLILPDEGTMVLS